MMKTEKMHTAVRFAAVLLVAVLCVLACAACGRTDPPATAEQTTAAPKVTEPAIESGGVSPVRLADGATAELVPAGLRFTGIVGKAYLDALKAAYGKDNVKVGLLIAPTASLTGASVDANGEKTVRIIADTLETDGDVYRFDCVLSDLTEQNYAENYSAVSFVEVGGSILRRSFYSAERNSISLSDAAETAYFDLRDAEDGEYRYAVKIGDNTRYSPYTEEQRALLREYRFASAFTVMCYNIEVFDSENGWEGRDPAKALSTVAEQSPDVVGLQEVSKEWDDMLAEFATANGYTRLTGDYSVDKFEKNEILFKTDKFTLVEEGTKVLTLTAAELGVANTEKAVLLLDRHGRVFHYAVLEQKETGKRFLVVSTHLHYGGTGSGHEEDDKVRRYQIRALLAWLEGQAETYPDQIVMGDMNSHYKGGQGKVNMEVFTDGGFTMTFDSAETTGDVDGTLASKHGPREKWVFDYILTKGNVRTAYYTVVDNPVDAQGSYPSDHIPILVKVCCK